MGALIRPTTQCSLNSVWGFRVQGFRDDGWAVQEPPAEAVPPADEASELPPNFNFPKPNVKLDEGLGVFSKVFKGLGASGSSLEAFYRKQA